MPEVQGIDSFQTPSEEPVLRFRVIQDSKEVVIERKKEGSVSVHWPTEVTRDQFLHFVLNDPFMPFEPQVETAIKSEDGFSTKSQMIRPGKLLSQEIRADLPSPEQSDDHIDFLALSAGEYEATWEYNRYESVDRNENEITVLFKERPTPKRNLDVETGHTDIGYLNELRSFYVEVLEEYMTPSDMPANIQTDCAFEDKAVQMTGLLLFSPWELVENISEGVDLEVLEEKLTSHFNTSMLSKIEAGDYTGAYWEDRRRGRKNLSSEESANDSDESANQKFTSENPSDSLWNFNPDSLQEEALNMLRVANKNGTVTTGRRATRRAIKSGRAELVYLDESGRETKQLAQIASQNNIPYIHVRSSGISNAISSATPQSVATIIDPGKYVGKFNELKAKLLRKNPRSNRNDILKR